MGRLTGLALALAAAAATSAAVAAPAVPPPGAPVASPAGPAPVVTLSSPTDNTPAKRGRETRVFISPSGEPFRQAPGDPDPLKAWFDQVDAAHKGYIDRADFRADAVRFFGKLDENGDKVIDGFEVADYEAKIAPELAEWASGEFPGEFQPARGRQGRGRPGEGTQAPGGKGQGAQGQTADQRRERSAQRGVYQLINEPEPVANADFNLDSRISFDEWMQATDRRFTILDANKDGRVTLDELRARFLPIKK